MIDVPSGAAPRVQDDEDALRALGTVAVLARQRGVPFVPIYVCSPEIGEEILDYTVTYGCDTLIMGESARLLFWRKVEGDVVKTVAENLPPEVKLVLRPSTPYVSEAPAERQPGQANGRVAGGISEESLTTRGGPTGNSPE